MFRTQPEPTAPVPHDALEQAARLRQRVRLLELRSKRLVSDALAGAYRSSFRGSGIEFDEVRPYQPGDDTRAIDWNVTARTGEPHIKRFCEDRQLLLHVLLDASPSMDFASRGAGKRAAAAELVGLLGAAAARQSDPIGMDLFGAFTSGSELGHVPRGRGDAQVVRLLTAALLANEPPRREGTDGGGLARALEELLRHLRRRALVFVVSDFGDLDHGDAWRAPLERLGARHDVVLARVRDPLEEDLPAAGVLVLADPESGETLELDSDAKAVRAAYAARSKARREWFRTAAARARCETLELDASRPVHGPLLTLFQRRAAAGGRV